MIQCPTKPDLQNFFKADDEKVKEFISKTYDLNTIVAKAMSYAFRVGFGQGQTYANQLRKYQEQERRLDDDF